MGDRPYKVTASLAFKGGSVQVPEGSEGNFKPDPEGGTASVDHEGDPTKSGYLNFDSSGVSKINWN